MDTLKVNRSCCWVVDLVKIVLMEWNWVQKDDDGWQIFRFWLACVFSTNSKSRCLKVKKWPVREVLTYEY